MSADDCCVIQLDLTPPPAIDLSLTPELVRLSLSECLQGPPGPPGGGTYMHAQNDPAAVWNVAHNMGRYPSVTVVDSNFEEIYPDVKYLDSNVIRVTHGAAITGLVFIN